MRRIVRAYAARAVVLSVLALPMVASAAVISATTTGSYTTAGATGVVGSTGNVLQINATDTLTFNGSAIGLTVPDNGLAIATSFGSFTFSGAGFDSFSNVGFTLNIAQSTPTPTPPGTAQFPSTISGFLYANNGNITLTFNSPLSKTINGPTTPVTYTIDSPQNNVGGGLAINGSVSVPEPAGVAVTLAGFVGLLRRRRS